MHLKNKFNSQGKINNTKKLGETSIMLLVHPNISKELMIEYATQVKLSIAKLSN